MRIMCVAVVLGAACASGATREVLEFNAGWRFHLGDAAGFEASGFNDSKWTSVRLPHDFSIGLPRDFDDSSLKDGAYFQTGIGCYRKEFKVPEAWLSKAVTIDFDGIYENGEIWINGHSLGKRPYGYVPVWHEISGFLKAGKNVVAVRADNSNQPNSRWYTGSGIYRKATLTVANKTHVAYHGVRIETKPEGANGCRLDVAVEVQHGVPGMALEFSVAAQDGTVVATEIAAADGTASVLLKNPVRWSPETPHLYTLETRLKVAGKVVDEHMEIFGVRDFRMDPKEGLFLNGKSIKLKGVCLHHDAGSVGSAFYRPIWKRRLRLLKEAGCNAIRTSHNIAARELIELCDEMGMIVLEEAFDGLRMQKREQDYHLYFDEWWREDLKNMILRDRNSPSVVMWSIGNEIKEKGDAENGPPLVRAMVEEVHRLDPTRPATCGNNFIFAANKAGVSQELDVVGYNDGGGSVWEYANDKAAYPDRLIYGSEVPHTFATRGMYKTTTRVKKAKKDAELSGSTKDKGEWVPNLAKKELWPENKKYASSYDNDYTRISVRGSWKLTRDLPFMIGEFRWTGIDYIGESGNRTNNDFGVLDLCGFKKDPYYLLQSLWTTEPMVHLLPHWTHTFKKGTVIPVWAYSNCDEVELFLNGKSLGRQTMDPDVLRIEWKVPYAPGKLEARAYRAGKPEAATVRVTAGRPACVVLTADKTAMTASGSDVVHIRAEIQDGQGNICPTAMNLVEFKVKGVGTMLGVDNGDPYLEHSFVGEHMPAFNGLCQLLVKSTDEAGRIEITATADGLKSGSMIILSAPSAD
ncbi:DUF4982 domain-containing protein [Pontiella sulfatireligans]|nr:DUF4982 domain-containing protein [Pontiella sulfatireligans]